MARHEDAEKKLKIKMKKYEFLKRVFALILVAVLVYNTIDFNGMFFAIRKVLAESSEKTFTINIENYNGGDSINYYVISGGKVIEFSSAEKTKKPDKTATMGDPTPEDPDTATPGEPIVGKNTITETITDNKVVRIVTKRPVMFSSPELDDTTYEFVIKTTGDKIIVLYDGKYYACEDETMTITADTPAISNVKIVENIGADDVSSEDGIYCGILDGTLYMFGDDAKITSEEDFNNAEIVLTKEEGKKKITYAVSEVRNDVFIAEYSLKVKCGEDYATEAIINGEYYSVSEGESFKIIVPVEQVDEKIEFDSGYEIEIKYPNYKTTTTIGEISDNEVSLEKKTIVVQVKDAIEGEYVIESLDESGKLVLGSDFTIFNPIKRIKAVKYGETSYAKGLVDEEDPNKGVIVNLSEEFDGEIIKEISDTEVIEFVVETETGITVKDGEEEVETLIPGECYTLESIVKADLWEVKIGEEKIEVEENNTFSVNPKYEGKEVLIEAYKKVNGEDKKIADKTVSVATATDTTELKLSDYLTTNGILVDLGEKGTFYHGDESIGDVSFEINEAKKDSNVWYEIDDSGNIEYKSITEIKTPILSIKDSDKYYVNVKTIITDAENNKKWVKQTFEINYDDESPEISGKVDVADNDIWRKDEGIKISFTVTDKISGVDENKIYIVEKTEEIPNEILDDYKVIVNDLGAGKYEVTEFKHDDINVTTENNYCLVIYDNVGNRLVEDFNIQKIDNTKPIISDINKKFGEKENESSISFKVTDWSIKTIKYEINGRPVEYTVGDNQSEAKVKFEVKDGYIVTITDSNSSNLKTYNPHISVTDKAGNEKSLYAPEIGNVTTNANWDVKDGVAYFNEDINLEFGVDFADGAEFSSVTVIDNENKKTTFESVYENGKVTVTLNGNVDPIKLCISVEDTLGNITTETKGLGKEDYQICLDQIAPQITVTYYKDEALTEKSENNSDGKIYYAYERYAVIDVDEKYFDENVEEFVLKVTPKGPNVSEYWKQADTKEIVGVIADKNIKSLKAVVDDKTISFYRESGKYRAIIILDEGTDIEYSISYSDPAKNDAVIGGDYKEPNRIIIDNTAPILTEFGIIGNNTRTTKDGIIKYFNSNVTIEFSIAEINGITPKLSVGGVSYELKFDKEKGVYSCTLDGEVNLADIVLICWDAAGNEIEIDTEKGDFYIAENESTKQEIELVSITGDDNHNNICYGKITIDKTKPEVESITFESPKNDYPPKNEANAEEVVAYFNGSVVLKFNIKEINMSGEQEDYLLKIKDLKDNKEVSMSDDEIKKINYVITNSDAEKFVTVTIPGDIVKKLDDSIIYQAKLIVTDMARNTSTDELWSGKFVYDVTNPVLSSFYVTGPNVFTEGNTEYFNGAVTIQGKFNDTNIDWSTVKVTIKDEKINENVEVLEAYFNEVDKKWTFNSSLENGHKGTIEDDCFFKIDLQENNKATQYDNPVSISFEAKDLAGNNVTIPTSTSKNKYGIENTKVDVDGKCLSQNGHIVSFNFNIIVDTEAPVVESSILSYKNDNNMWQDEVSYKSTNGDENVVYYNYTKPMTIKFEVKEKHASYDVNDYKMYVYEVGEDGSYTQVKFDNGAEYIVVKDGYDRSNNDIDYTRPVVIWATVSQNDVLKYLSEKNKYVAKLVVTDKARNDNFFDDKVTDNAFVYDVTAPQVDIKYGDYQTNNGAVKKNEDDNISRDGYKLVTITVTENNFDASRFTLKLDTEANNGSAVYIRKLDNTTGKILENKNDLENYIVNEKNEKINIKDNLAESLHYQNYWTTIEGSASESRKHIVVLEVRSDAVFSFYVDKDDKNKKILTDKANNYNYDKPGLSDNDKYSYRMILDGTAPTIGNLQVTYNGHALSQAGNVYYSDNSKIVITFSTSDGTSGVHAVYYMLKDGSTGFVADNRLEISPEYYGGLKLRVVDRAGNSSGWLDIDTLIADSKKPQLEIKLNTETNENGFMNKDANITLTVNEELESSGIYSVDYTAGSAANVVHNLNSQGKPVATWTENVTMDAVKNNNNDVKVLLNAEDNAKNKSNTEASYKIDVTKPVITVTYDENEPLNEKYYNKVRTALVTINEYNFDSSRVKFTMTRDGEAVLVTPNFTTDGVVRTAADGSFYITYTMLVQFAEDGDYTFTLEATDLADNKSEYGVVDEFTIDRTTPVIVINYNNNNVLNNRYYGEARVATIAVTEHNFRPADFNLHLNATDNGQGIAAPAMSGFTSIGDTHVATINFNTDAEITLSADYTDMAGNQAVPLATQNFVIDLTDPVITIDNVKSGASYGNKMPVQPSITLTDTNYDANAVTVTLAGNKIGTIKEYTFNISDIANGQVFNFADIEYKQELDDCYTLSVETTDLAGHTSSDMATFRVNRYGSVYTYDNDFKNIVDNYYVKKIDQDIVIYELNVNKIKLDTLKINCNMIGSIKELVSGTDYTIEESTDKYGWNQYTYRISKSLFERDGVYTITISSEDEAKNIANSTAKGNEITFCIDTTTPTVLLSGIDNGGVYVQDNLSAVIQAYDNIAISKLIVYLNGETKEYHEEDFSDGKIYVSIPSSSNRQSMRIECYDVSGNVVNVEEIKFTVSTSQWVAFRERYLRNPLAIGGTGIAVVAIGGTAWWWFIFRKKKLMHN